jgi:hypothetical protein
MYICLKCSETWLNLYCSRSRKFTSLWMECLKIFWDDVITCMYFRVMTFHSIDLCGKALSVWFFHHIYWEENVSLAPMVKWNQKLVPKGLMDKLN